MTQLRDRRRPPFFWIGVGAAKILGERFSGKRLTTARAIYSAFAEAANEARSSEFAATRQCVAALAGVSDRTLDSYAREFVDAGLLEIEHRREGTMHLPNMWSLVGGSEAKRTTPRSQTHHPGEAKRTRGSEANSTHVTQEERTPNGVLSRGIINADRPEIGRLCHLLAKAMLANDPNAKVAPDSEPWRTAARLLLDRDSRGEADIADVIRWSQADNFWCRNVLSMPKLRKHFPRLFLEMRKPRAAGTNVVSLGERSGGRDLSRFDGVMRR